MRYVDEARGHVLAAAKGMLRRGLVEGTAGNISARQRDGTLVITPASADYAAMELDDLVIVAADGSTLHCKDGRSPSSEKMLHLACYRAFDDIGAVMHSHPVHATMFAVTHQAIPACIDEFAMYVGGEVRCTRVRAERFCRGRRRSGQSPRGQGCGPHRQPRHGGGRTRPGAALHITALVERSARITWGARSLGPLHPLPDAVNDRFAGFYADRRRNPT